MANAKLSPNQRLILKCYVKLMRCAETVTARMHRHLATHGLTLSQFGVLEALLHLGPMRQSQIGRKILKTSGNMTMVIDNLEKQDLVSRQPDAGDRRAVVVSLTDKGLQLIRSVLPQHARVAESVFSPLTPQQHQQLGRLLKKLGTANRDD